MTDMFLSWATQQIWQAQEVNGQGTTRAAIFRQIEKATQGKVTPMGRTKNPPSCLIHVWEWFLTLADCYSDLGSHRIPGPACWREDLNTLIGMRPEPWEIRILSQLFSIWIRHQKS